MTRSAPSCRRHASSVTVKRQHEPQKIVGDLLHAEISESEPFCAIGSSTMASARSIKDQMTIARLPLAKEIDEFTFEETPVNETLVRDLASGARHCPRTNGGQRLALGHQRNVVLIGDEPCRAIGRSDNGEWNRQDPPRRQHRPGLHPQRPARPVLQRRRSGQQARCRSPRRPVDHAGAIGSSPMVDAAPPICSPASTCSPSPLGLGPMAPRWATLERSPVVARTRGATTGNRRDGALLDELGYLPFAQTGGQLFAIGLDHRATRWLTPPHQQTLRARFDCRHHQPGIRRVARSPLCLNQWRINGSPSATRR